MFKSRPLAARRRLLVTIVILFGLFAVSFLDKVNTTAQLGNDPAVVGIAKTPDSSPTDEEIDTAVRDAIALSGGLPDTIGSTPEESALKKVVIQPNLVEAGWPESEGDNVFKSPGVVTDVRVVRTIINMLLEAGVSVDNITICEGSAGFREYTTHEGYTERQMTLKAFHDAGFDSDGDMYDDMTGVKLVDANYAGEYVGSETGLYPPYPDFKGTYDPNYVTKIVKGGYWVDRAYYIPNCVATCDALIRVPVLKNHDLAGYTGGIKLAFGLAPSDIYHHYALPYYKWDLLHGEPSWYGGLGELENNARGQADMNYARPPDLVVIDGLVGITTGPTRQYDDGHVSFASPFMGCIIAGHNVVATDTIGCLAIGYRVNSIPGIQRASEMGLGTCDINNIEVKGAHVKDIRRWFWYYANDPNVAIPGDNDGPDIIDLSVPEDALVTADHLVVTPEGYSDDDPGIIKGELYVDNKLIGSSKSAASSYQVTWNIDDDVAEGGHTLKYVMYDGMLNEGYIIRHVNVYKDNGVGDPPVNESLAPNSGTLPGAAQFTLTSAYSDPDGYANITDAYFIINTSASTSNAIYLRYSAASNRLYLRSYSSTPSWLGGYTPGSGNVIENSNCRIYCNGTTVSKSGTNLIVNWRLELKSSMEGKTCGAWAVVWDSDSNFDGEQFSDKMGTFKVTRLPKNVSLSPTSSTVTSGTKMTFASKWSDADGAADLASCQMLINTVLSEANGIDLKYDANERKLYLRNDNDSDWLGGYAAGSNYVIENSNCKLYCKETTVTTSGAVIYVNWKLEMKAAMADHSCSTWYSVYDDPGSHVGWTKMGALNVIYPVANLGVSPKNLSTAPRKKLVLTSKYNHNDGYAKMADVYLMIGSNLSDTDAACFKYDSNGNKIYARKGLSGVWSAGYKPGTSQIIDMPYCRLHCNATKASGSGKCLTVSWTVEFKQEAAPGTYKMWVLGYDDNGLYDGWDESTEISVSLPPVNDSLDPSLGTLPSNIKTLLTSRYTDSISADNLADVYLSLNTVLGVSYLRYDVNNNKLYARSSMTGAWTGGYAPGSGQTITAGLTRLYCSSTTALKLGDLLTVNWSVSVNSNGRYNIACETWLLCYNDAGLFDGWDKAGRYTIQ